jgi:Domain of unknown function (DUF4430)
VTLRRIATLLLALCVLAGCGEEASGNGTAQLWVTRDRGSEVVLSTTVPAGISAMEALRRKADVETRYGGRFVQSIDDIEGDIAGHHDWFYFVNGYEADLSAADYRLHDGDVLWWDHRSWEREMRQPVVVGAFPEPFLHGWNGKRRPAIVVYQDDRLEKTARRLARILDASVGSGHPLQPIGANVVTLVEGDQFVARLTGGPGDKVVFVVGADAAARLADDPTLARYRYEGLPLK